jgi:hypothetical protein
MRPGLGAVRSHFTGDRVAERRTAPRRVTLRLQSTASCKVGIRISQPGTGEEAASPVPMRGLAAGSAALLNDASIPRASVVHRLGCRTEEEPQDEEKHRHLQSPPFRPCLFRQNQKRENRGDLLTKLAMLRLVEIDGSTVEGEWQPDSGIVEQCSLSTVRPTRPLS